MTVAIGLISAVSFAPVISHAQGIGPDAPTLAGEVGGVIGALGSDAEHDYVAIGRRLLVYEAGAGPSDAPIAELPPQARKIVAVDRAGPWLLLSTGRPGGRGALVVVDLSRPEAPREVGRLGLLPSPLDVAWDGRSVWLARGTSGLAKVDLSVPSAPRIVGTWKPRAAEGRPRFVRAATGRADRIVLLDAPSSEVGLLPGTLPRPDRLVTLDTSGAAAAVLAELPLAEAAAHFHLSPKRAVVSERRHLAVMSWRDARAPRIETRVPRGDEDLIRLVTTDEVLAAVHLDHNEGGLGHLLVKAYDLSLDGRWLGARPVWLHAEDWRGLVSRDGTLLLADGDGLSRIRLRPEPKNVAVARVPTRRYVRVVAAADGALAITDSGALDHVAADGTLTRLSADGVQVTDVAATPHQLLAIVAGRGIVELQPGPEGKWQAGDRLLGSAGDDWRTLHASGDNVVAVGYLDGEPGLLAAAMSEHGPRLVATIAAAPVGQTVILDEDRLWLVDAVSKSLGGWDLWRGSRPERLRSLPLAITKDSHPGHAAGSAATVLVAVVDKSKPNDLVYGIDTRVPEGPRVDWHEDMPGQVLALAAHGDTAWAAWRSDEPGLTQLDLRVPGGSPRSSFYRGGWIHSLAAHGDSVWAVMSEGALARYHAGRRERPPERQGTPTPDSPPAARGPLLLPWLFAADGVGAGS